MVLWDARVRQAPELCWGAFSAGQLAMSSSATMLIAFTLPAPASTAAGAHPKQATALARIAHDELVLDSS